MIAFRLALFALLLIWSVAAGCAHAAPAPYPASKVITGITWSPALVRNAEGSDNWPVTWADDNALYTAYGDGWGFEPRVASKLSLGFAKVAGSPPDISGTNIRSASGERTGDDVSGEKASGMLMVDGTLYMWARNANDRGEGCRLAWSEDRARTWTWSGWTFPELGYCAFLGFGRNYAGARDSYVYMYSPDTPSAYDETDEVALTRVAKDRLTEERAYEFFAGFNGAGAPTWTKDSSERASVFTIAGGANRLSVTYNAPLGRYLMTMRSRARAGGRDAFGLYEAPEPWGPWRTVYYTEDADEWGEAAHIPSKWISPDGKTLHLVYSGDDSFSVRRATLTVAADDAGSGIPPGRAN